MSLVGERGTTIGGLWRSVGWGMVDRLLGPNMVVVKVMLSVTLIAFVPPGSLRPGGRDEARCYQDEDRHLKS